MNEMKFQLSIAEPVIKAEVKPDTRSYVERMFNDFDTNSGEQTPLPIRAQDASKVSKISDLIIEPNSIPLILSMGSEVEDYSETNNMKKGENLLIIGGVRQGKAGLGKIMIPISEVNKFCEHVQAIAAAATAKLPELLVQMKEQK